MITYKQFLAAALIVNEYRLQTEANASRFKALTKVKDLLLNIPTRETLIKDANLSVRALNALKNEGLDTKRIGDLDNYRISDLSAMPSMGKKSIEEIKDLCFLCGTVLKP